VVGLAIRRPHENGRLSFGEVVLANLTSLREQYHIVAVRRHTTVRTRSCRRDVVPRQAGERADHRVDAIVVDQGEDAGR